MILRRNHPRKQSSKRKVSDIFSSSPRKVSRKSKSSIKSRKISHDNLLTKQKKLKQDVLQGRELKLMIKPINIDDLQMVTSNKDSRKESSSGSKKRKPSCRSSIESHVNNLKLSAEIVTESQMQVSLQKNGSLNSKIRESQFSQKQLDDLTIPTLSLSKGEETFPEYTRKTRSLSRKSEASIGVNKSVLKIKSKKSSSNVHNLKLSGEIVTKNQEQVPLLKNASFNSKKRESRFPQKQLDDLTIPTLTLREKGEKFPEFTRKTRSLSRKSEAAIRVNNSELKIKSKKSREQSNGIIDDLCLLSPKRNKGEGENSPMLVRKTRSLSRMSKALTEVNKSIHHQLSRNSSAIQSTKKINIVDKHSGNQLSVIQNEVQPQETAFISSKAIKVPFFYQKLFDLNISTSDKENKENIPVFNRITRSLIRKLEISAEVEKSVTQAKAKSDNGSTNNSKENKTAQNKKHKKIDGNSEGGLNKKITEAKVVKQISKAKVVKQISKEVSVPDSMRRSSLRVRHHTVEPIKDDLVKTISKTKKPQKRHTIEVDKKTIRDDDNKNKISQTKRSVGSNKKTAKNSIKTKNSREKQVDSVTKKVSKTKPKRRHTTVSGSRTPKQKKILSKSDNFSSPISEKSYLNGIPLDDLNLTLFKSPSFPLGGKNPVSSTPIVNSKMIKNKIKPFKQPALKGINCSTIPTKGSLKRKRWLMNNLKEKNEGYEDDLFESKNFGQFKEMIQEVEDFDETLDDSDLSMWSIATPKCAFLVTPNICAKSPRFKDCYSPSELLKARKVAEEVMHMRNKKRKSESGLNPPYCENLTSKLNSASKSAGELPEKKKLEFIEMIQSIPKASDAVEEEDGSDKDDYFSDASS